MREFPIHQYSEQFHVVAVMNESCFWRFCNYTQIIVSILQVFSIAALSMEVGGMSPNFKANTGARERLMIYGHNGRMRLGHK